MLPEQEKKITLTIAIPSYNKEGYIERCLNSILHEKEYIDKIILIDNCSTDNTFGLAKKYEPEIRCYKNDTNLGMSGNWNRCIDLCTTDWLMIFHADDELLPGSIEKYLRFIAKYPTAGIIYAGANTVINGVIQPCDFSKENKELRNSGLDAMLIKQNMTCSTVMVKKEVYNKLGYFIESSISSDVEMWMRIRSKYDLGYVIASTVNYHINPSSTGLDSLVNRDIKEIQADWELLNNKMSQYFPTEMSRNKFLEQSFRDAPGGYWAVAKANLRIGNYSKACRAINLIIFEYRGLIPLMSIFISLIKKYSIKFFNSKIKKIISL